MAKETIVKIHSLVRSKDRLVVNDVLTAIIASVEINDDGDIIVLFKNDEKVVVKTDLY